MEVIRARADRYPRIQKLKIIASTPGIKLVVYCTYLVSAKHGSPRGQFFLEASYELHALHW